LATLFYAPKNSSDRKALDKAVERGQLQRIRTGVYTDSDEPLENIVERHLPSILALGFPAWTLSHSTAALLKPANGSAFISRISPSRSPATVGTITIHRLKAFPHPETTELDLGDTVARSLSAEPEPVRIRVSSPLQTVFELLDTDARQPDRTLPPETIRGLIDALSETDKRRAAAFAERNGLLPELKRFHASQTHDAVYPDMRRRHDSLDLFFYRWHVGTLESLGAREFRFAYDDGWQIELPGLRHNAKQAAYEGPGLPPFFDNLLPEGWAEARLQAVHKIARTDTFALLRTTQKYLSNFTLRSPGFDASSLILDHLDVTLTAIGNTSDPLLVDDSIGADPDSRDLWMELQRRGATRLSGIQPKLPIHVALGDERPRLEIGHARNTSTHILKLPSPAFEHLVDNEWTTLELARRVGLEVPRFRRVDFSEGSSLRGPGLLIERFDLPASLTDPPEILMLEEAAQLLGLRRDDKYTRSLERVAGSLIEAGMDVPGMDRFFDHVVFSWIVGNGDMHAKNIAVLRSIKPGALGSGPQIQGTRYSPLYDLVNTSLIIPGDLFALPVNGKQKNLRRKDFSALAKLWGARRDTASARIESLATSIRQELSAILELSHLPESMKERYQRTVDQAIDGL
jgi:serine/threonine-protein kinase HipA